MQIKSGKMVEYSEQELIDCAKGADGCDGGELHIVAPHFVPRALVRTGTRERA